MDKKSDFLSFFNQQLNQKQQQAVAPEKGILLVAAGAGSGKTRVITSRIIYLITQHIVSPRSIIALTFTNKAAREMRERVTQYLGTHETLPFIGTFHGYALQMLKTYGPTFGIEQFSILDQDDQKQILHKIIKRKNLEKRITTRTLGYQISIYKNHIATAGSIEQPSEPLLPELLKLYEQEKNISKCLDFDDLLLEFFKLIKNNEEFRALHHRTVSHILIDEYQDTNTIQHALLKQCTMEHKKLIVQSLCVVGDEDQSIYSWRGATVTNIINFKKDFPDAQTITLEQNYRSVQPILKTANAIIKKNCFRNEKNLWSDQNAQDCIRQLTCISDYQEGEVIASFLNAYKKKHSLKSSAILYRAHFHSRSLEEALIRNGIPYHIVSGIQFYERKEIKDILAYVRLIANPHDRVSFFRILNTPARGFGKKFEELFDQKWQLQPFLPWYQIAHELVNTQVIAGKKQEALTKLINLLHLLQPNDLPEKVIKQLLTTIGYTAYLKDQYEASEAESRIENIKELLRALDYFKQQGIITITDFLHEVSLLQEKINAQNKENDYVLLMTLHAAKGLEFETVILSGLEEGSFPSGRALQDTRAIEEERRLFYVGITRAKQKILFTYSRFRFMYGKTQEQVASRFIDELNTDYCTAEDVSFFKPFQQTSYFNQWLGNDQESSDVITFGITPSTRISKPSKCIKKITNLGNSNSIWRIKQMVQHKTFGIGYITKIEKKGTKTNVTVQFSNTEKKVTADFLTSL